MAINSFNVSYPDFQLDTIINPDEFDINFDDIGIRLNQIIEVLNQITDGIGGSGASVIHLEEVLPFLSKDLQSFLEELVATLHEGGTGAQFISSVQIPGVTGVTVQEQLDSLGTLVDGLRTDLESEVVRLGELIQGNTDSINTLDGRATVLETKASNLDLNKVSREEIYTRIEADQNAQALEDGIYANVYNKDEADALLGGKTDVSGNHEGTWQGLHVEDIAGAIHAKDLVIANVQPVGQEGLLWFNPSDNTYTVFLNGQWRATGRLVRYEQVLNRVVLGADTDTVTIGIPGFDPSIDLLTVHVNATYMAKGFDYIINTDGTVTFDGVLVTGSVIDFEANIVTAN